MSKYKWRKELSAQHEAALVLIENADWIPDKDTGSIQEVECAMAGWGFEPHDSERVRKVVTACLNLIKDALQ